MLKQLEHKVIHKIMDRAIEINSQCKEACRDFRIMTSVMRKNTLILRWNTINIDNIDKPIQYYQYECFNSDGTSQNCSVNYADQQEANDFFESLKSLYKQDFCIDHKM